MKVSVVIPVYKKPKLVNDILGKLLANTFSNKEIIVIVDGKTNEEIEKALSCYKDRIKVVYNTKQLGKAGSLNNVALNLHTDYLVFFDNDILIPDRMDFISDVVAELSRYDLVEFPKEAIAGTVLSDMLAFEFMSFAIWSYTFSKFAHRSPSMNGAAFAIKKDLFVTLQGFHPVVNEDMDLAFRSFMEHARYSFNPELKVYNELPATFGEWLTQRKRWAVNNILWLKKNIGNLIRDFFKDNMVRLSFLFILFPIIASIVLYFTLHYFGLTSLLPLIMVLGVYKHIIIGLFLGLVHYQLFTFGIVPIIIGLVTTFLFYLTFSFILRFRFNPISFIMFYIFYIPVWMFANIIFGIGVILNMDMKLDWKVSE